MESGIAIKLMNTPLPPKRFQQVDDPRYDPIRPRKWFSHLRKRRAKIPALEQACKSVAKYGTQLQSAVEWGVDERELRDYIAFKFHPWPKPSPTFQAILDGAYELYSEHNAIHPIRYFIEDVAPLYGVNPRHVWELWETNPDFYPTNYKL